MGLGWPPRDVSKIQDGFVGPGTSLIVESVQRLRRKTKTKAAAQVATTLTLRVEAP